MILFGYLRNKYPKIIMINIAINGGFGIIFGINTIIGGLAFIPYLILAAKHKEESLFDAILNNNISIFYGFLFLILIFCGLYWNNSSFNKLKSKILKSK